MFTKNLRDALLLTTKAFPAANATALTDSFDLLGSSPTDVSNVLVPERVELKLEVPALPNNVTSADPVVLNFQDSADGVTFANITGLAPVSIPGVASTGSAAMSVNVRPPPTTRRYVAVQLAPVTGSGDNTASSATFSLVY